MIDRIVDSERQENQRLRAEIELWKARWRALDAKERRAEEDSATNRWLFIIIYAVAWIEVFIF